MLKCNEVSHLIASGESARLSWIKKLQLRLHLLMCHHCRRYSTQLELLGRMARKIWGPRVEDKPILTRLEENIVQNCFDGTGGDGSS